MVRKLTLSFAALALLGACATLENDVPEQSIAIRTQPPTNAQCQLSTKAKMQRITAPGTITVKHSRENIQVRCMDAVTGSTGEALLIPEAPRGASSHVFGDFHFSADHAWKYPETIVVKMKDVVEVAPHLVGKSIPVETLQEKPATKLTTKKGKQAPFAKQAPAKMPATKAPLPVISSDMPERTGTIAPVPMFVLPEHVTETR